jgi:Xaa-Pro dipeptidase
MISATALADAKSYLRESGLDGWLLADFQHGNPVFDQVVGGRRHTTRRCFLLITPEGPPTFLLHFIDAGRLADLGWPIQVYRNLGEQDAGLRRLLAGRRRVAMEYSPDGALPVVSRVDAGTVERVRGLGSEVVSSADLLQYAVARWTPEQLAGHREAAAKLGEVVLSTFTYIGQNLDRGIREHHAVAYMLGLFDQMGLTTEDPPTVCVDAHSGDPHYSPSPEASAELRRGQWVLIDLWAKLLAPEAVYADITWVGYAGDRPPTEHARVFGVVRDARDRAIEFLGDSLAAGRPVEGWEVDRVAREVIAAAGLGDHFTHRLGHSIGTAIHSNGVNLDGYETRDTRRLIPGVGVSVEPGVYLPEFGVRTEVDVYVSAAGPEVTTPIQREIVRIGS